MYLTGFVASYGLVRYQIRKKGINLSREFVESLYTYLILGLLLGARAGYVIFYDPGSYIRQPFEILAVWHGGMSFHGGLIGSVIAGTIFCRKTGVDAWTVADLVVVTAPIGLGCGRIGNFINGELYGRVSDVPWAMVFPTGGPAPRHPSQLYEFSLEGVLLFLILWSLKDRGLRPGVLTALFIILYGVSRFFIEFFREPDSQLGFVVAHFSMGQILSGVMIVAGAVIFFLRYRTH
jgi:phosphatidylglycerol:prolipoprotein diacylglycerol transferase